MNSVTRKSKLRAAIAVLSAVFVLPFAVFGQNGVVARQEPAPQPTVQQQNPPAQNPITQPLALSPPVSSQRVGVREGEVQSLALQDSIRLALQNNLDIEQFRQGVRISERSLYSLKGAYDIVSSADINFRSQTIPVANLFAGGGSAGSFTSRTMAWNFITNQFVEQTGGFWQAELDNNRVHTSNTASTLSTQYSPVLLLSFTQP